MIVGLVVVLLVVQLRLMKMKVGSVEVRTLWCIAIACPGRSVSLVVFSDVEDHHQVLLFVWMLP